MRLPLPGALLAGALGAACGATKVAPPPTPPAFAPAAARSEAPSAGRAEPGVEQRVEPERGGTRATLAEPTAEPARPTASPDASRAALPPEPSAPLGWIAGKPLEAEELLLEWGDIASREMWLVLDKLVAARLALAEAERLGIRLVPEAVEQRFAAERAKLEKEIARKGKSADLEQFIARELGFEPARYLERVRRATIRQMLAERAVRAASLASESVSLRLIVVASDEGQAAVEAALASGRDFAAVARELSVDDTKEDGGFVPFVVRDPRSPLAQLAFQTAPGEVAGPLPVGEHQFWIRVEERREPLEGDWKRVEAPVEASLAAIPVENAEFLHWRVTLEGRYPIDLGPLWSLLGAAK
jgi:hypothetical protein